MGGLNFSYVVDANSSTTPLTNGQTFTGVWTIADQYASMSVALLTDQDSTLYVDFSPDGTNVDSTLSYQAESGVNEVHRLAVTRKYFRVRVSNASGGDQTYLRLQSILGEQGPLTSPLNSVVQGDADAIMVRSRDAEFDIASGRMQGVYIVNKFGRNPAVSTADVPEDIWDGGGAYTGFPLGVSQVLTVTSSSDQDTLTTGTGAWTLRIYGLDASGVDQTEDVNLNGTTGVDTLLSFSRVYRAQVLTSASSNQAFNVGVITIKHKVATANIFAAMPVGVSQTQLAIYTTPAGKVSYLRNLQIVADRTNTVTINGGIWVRNNGASPRIIRPFVITNSVDFNDRIYGGLVFPALTDIAIRITACTVNNVSITCNFDLIVADV